MKRLSVPILTIVATLLFVAIPTLAEEGKAQWRISLVASTPNTVVSFDGRYCLMPDTMPIRPGNNALLQDGDKLAIGTATFADAVEDALDPARFAPEEPCYLFARFLPIAPQDGLRVIVKPFPRPVSGSASQRVKIMLVVGAFGSFDWSYDAAGYKQCHTLGDTQLGNNSPVVTMPDSRLFVGPDPDKTRLSSSVEFSEEDDEEYCMLIASLEFPIADEYVLEFGGEVPDAE